MTTLSRRQWLAASAAVVTAAALPSIALAAPTKAEATATMRRATKFMTEKVAYKGGYVWSYLPDFSRRWGEMEAYPTMIWVQPPGTATVGHVFLDAYHATGDEAYYAAAKQVAGALIAIQHPSGGWNYLGDLAGEASLKRWYDTIGKNGWRLEEFQHYYGNATFDDAGTSESSQFLLRLYMEKKDRAFKPALDKAIDFVLKSQYPVGGWPQRYPPAPKWEKAGHEDYTGYITFNDDVAGENIEFMLMVWQTLGDERAKACVRKAMDSFLACQQPAPQAGWGLQHTPDDLKPAAARTYEPKGFATHTTAQNIGQLMNFYELTGDTKYLARVPEALAWLDSVKLPDNVAPGKPRWPTFIEVGTNTPFYIHRRGSNVVNGQYYADRNPEKTLVHYSSFRNADTKPLRARYEKLKAIPGSEVSKNSPLLGGRRDLPRYFSTKDISVSDLNVGKVSNAAAGGLDAKAGEVITALNAEGWWPTPMRAMSQSYAGDGSPTPAPGDFSETRVGDRTDTSPYIDEKPVTGISTAVFVENMAALIRYIGET